MSETNKRAFATFLPYHSYSVPIYRIAAGHGIEVTGEMLEIKFVRGSKVIDENREPAEFPSKETACAITNLEQARHWMEERERARAAQGVLGTYQPHKS